MVPALPVGCAPTFHSLSPRCVGAKNHQCARQGGPAQATLEQAQHQLFFHRRSKQARNGQCVHEAKPDQAPQEQATNHARVHRTGSVQAGQKKGTGASAPAQEHKPNHPCAHYVRTSPAQTLKEQARTISESTEMSPLRHHASMHRNH